MVLKFFGRFCMLGYDCIVLPHPSCFCICEAPTRRKHGLFVDDAQSLQIANWGSEFWNKFHRDMQL